MIHSPGDFQNIQSNGLIVQMKKMSHICWPLAKVKAFRSPDSQRDRSSLLYSQEQLGMETGSPALSPGPLLIPPSVMMGVHNVQASGEIRLPGRHTEMFWERPQTRPSRVGYTDDCAYFWYPVKLVTGAIHQLSGLSAWQLPEDSRVFSETEPERAGLAGVQLAEACQGCGWHGQKLRHFHKGRRHSLLGALQTLWFQTRGGVLPWRKP